MGRARGANALMHLAYEGTYATPPVSGYKRLPFVSSQLGAERGLIESDLLGGGRSPYDPTPDVTNNDGDVVVPVDTQAIGYWLRLLLGDATVAAPVNGLYKHTFLSGKDAIPSASIEIAMPDVPSFSTNYGARAGTMQIAMQRSGLLTATFGLMCKGETVSSNTTGAGSPATIGNLVRFAQPTGYVSLADGTPLGNVVSGQLNFSNGMEKVETILPDGEIAGVDSGMPSASGNIVVRFADRTLLNLATSGVPTVLRFGWTSGNFSLTFGLGRVFLPRVKMPISGPGGIQASFNWQASGGGGPLMSADLTTPIADFTA